MDALLPAPVQLARRTIERRTAPPARNSQLLATRLASELWPEEVTVAWRANGAANWMPAISG